MCLEELNLLALVLGIDPRVAEYTFHKVIVRVIEIALLLCEALSPLLSVFLTQHRVIRK
jgi:hypothetical protein